MILLITPLYLWNSRSYKLISWCPHDKYHPSLSISKLILIVQSHTESAADPVCELGTLTSKMGALPFKCKDDAWQQDVTWWLLFSLDDEAVYNHQHSMTQSFIHSFMHYALQVQEENTIQFSPVSQSCPTLHTPMDHSTRHPCPSPALGVYSNSCPLSWWCHPTDSSSVVTFSSCLQSFPAQGLFKWVSSLHQVAKVLGFQLQHQSF